MQMQLSVFDLNDLTKVCDQHYFKFKANVVRIYKIQNKTIKMVQQITLDSFVQQVLIFRKLLIILTNKRVSFHAITQSNCAVHFSKVFEFGERPTAMCLNTSAMLHVV